MVKLLSIEIVIFILSFRN